MTRTLWQELVFPSGNDDHLSELFHENSKIGRHTHQPSPEDVKTHLHQLHASLSYEGLPKLALPSPDENPDVSLLDGLRSRRSVRAFRRTPISLHALSTLLFHSYGVTKLSDHTGLPRGFRAVPSAGGLYPLELYLHTADLEGHSPGLYHYEAEQACLRCIRAGDETALIANAMIQPDVGLAASILVFITAIFERSTFKYQDRGYRFALIEAGHVAQNLTLAAYALDFDTLSIGGFFDREVDGYLGIDGVTHSTLYMLAIGKRHIEANDDSSRRHTGGVGENNRGDTRHGQ